MPKVNTHSLYDTVDHQHLDSLVQWATGDYPASGLCLVKCADGRWFVEVDFGEQFDGLAGVSRPEVEPFEEPKFLTAEQEARNFAVECIKAVYPALAGRQDLLEWFEM